MQPLKRILLIGIITFFALLSASCNGGSYGIVQPNPEDLCKCLPVEPDILDFRHIAKHVPIPAIAAQEIGVDTILSWTQDAFVAPDAPRTGREHQVFHVATAFLHEASVNSADCDVHFEISMTADKNAPRVIVETIVDSEFCSARQAAQSQLKKHGFTLDSSHGGDCRKPCQSRCLAWLLRILTTLAAPFTWPRTGNSTPPSSLSRKTSALESSLKNLELVQSALSAASRHLRH